MPLFFYKNQEEKTFMKGSIITSINELNLEEITFEKMRWQYGTFLSHSVGKRSEKKTYTTKCVMTPIGEITESVWYQLAEFMIQREHEEELFNNLLQFETETTHNSCFDFKELRHYTLDLYVSRIFNHPRWIGFIPFNRKYRPDFIKNMKFIRIKSECCGAIGDVTEEQICPSGTPCPKCGRFAPFVQFPENKPN